MHTIRQGETIFDVANKYHVPVAEMASENNIGFQTPLQGGRELYVPLGPYNKMPNLKNVSYRNVYYRVRAEDNLYRISKMAGETQRTLQEWNELPDNMVGEGDVLVVARIIYDGAVSSGTAQAKAFGSKADTTKKQNAADSTKAPKYTIRKVSKEVMENGKPVTYLVNDTVWADTMGVYGRMYMEQTINETKITEERGKAVFYTLANKVQSRYTTTNGVKNNFIYAFHATAKRGSIIRVYNPASDKFVFVKVMGALPDTKQYAGSIIGIGADAKELLGVSIMEDKAWVELKYAP